MKNTVDGSFNHTLDNYMYGSVVEYSCGAARAFDNGDGTTDETQLLACEWEGGAVPATLKPCKWIQCLGPPDDMPATMEARYWDGLPLEQNATLDLYCLRGMKFEEDFDQVNFNITCGDDNTWIVPNNTWPNCTMSKKISR